MMTVCDQRRVCGIFCLIMRNHDNKFIGSAAFFSHAYQRVLCGYEVVILNKGKQINLFLKFDYYNALSVTPSNQATVVFIFLNSVCLTGVFFTTL